MTSLCNESNSYIRCVEQFGDLLFYCQQSPCYEQAQSLHDCLFRQLLTPQISSQKIPKKLVSNKPTQISNEATVEMIENLPRSTESKKCSEESTGQYDILEDKKQLATRKEPSSVQHNVRSMVSAIFSEQLPGDEETRGTLASHSAPESPLWKSISPPWSGPYTGVSCGARDTLWDTERGGGYSGFYAEYCRALCRCDPCRCWTKPRYNLLNSHFDSKCRRRSICSPIEYECEKTSESGSAVTSTAVSTSVDDGRAGETRDVPGASSMDSGNRECDLDSRNTQKRVKMRRPCSSKKKSCCKPKADCCKKGSIHVLQTTATLEGAHSVTVTSNIMVLFFVMICFYTVGLNIGEYFTYQAGLHGKTFFLVPYLLRCITIGFIFMGDFLSFLLIPNCMHSFLDLGLRTFVLSFLASTVWNIIEHFMEEQQIAPLLYFGASALVCLIAMGSFYRFVDRHGC